jgi:uncharacterized membrane protein YfcA
LSQFDSFRVYQTGCYLQKNVLVIPQVEMLYVYSVLIGLVAGVASGLLGIGGGVIIVPALILLIGMEPRQAIGLSLAVIIPTALVGFIKHFSYGNFDVIIFFALGSAAVVGGYLGATLAGKFSTLMLKRILGVTLILVGINTLINWSFIEANRESNEIEISRPEKIK